jgi:hypothetical protein
MLDELPKAICTEFEIMRNQNSAGGVSNCLPALFQALMKEKETKEYIYDLEKEVGLENRREEKKKMEAILWMQAKFNEIKKSPLSKYAFIASKVDNLEETLDFRRFRLDQNFISSVWDDLEAIVCAMAEFGENKIFDGWVQIGTRIGCETLSEEIISSEAKATECAPNSKMGKLLINIMEKGFVNATLIPARLRPGSEKMTTHIERGYVEQFILPECISRWYQCSQNDTELYMENLKTDPMALFRRLQFLSQYQDFRPVVLTSDHKPKSSQDIDRLSTQMLTSYYFSGFKPGSGKISLSSEKAISLVETFLLMTSRFRKERVKKRANRNDAKHFIQEHVLKLIQKVKSNGSTFPTNKELYDQIERIALRTHNQCASELTERLVADQCRILLEKAQIKRKGGRPKRK